MIEKYELELLNLFMTLPMEQQKIFNDVLRFGQIRTAGGNKFMFQYHGGVEAQFLATKKFAEIVDTLAVVGRGKLKSWHSNQKYTPVIFNYEPGTNKIKFILWFYHTDKPTPRAYEVGLTVTWSATSSGMKINGMNPGTSDE